jgi:tetratricopeptide (TPR) repeat protein/transglutaminase-like putative cysteine protease
LELAVRIQSQAGVQALGVLSFAYLSSNENVEVDYIRVRKPDGTIVNTPDYNVQDMPAEVTRVAPMYSDIHEKHITVKALGVGDVLEYRIRYRTFKPQVPGQFWWEYSFDKNAIYRDAGVEVSVPKDKYLNLASPKYKPEIREEGSHRIYTWKTSNLKRKDPEEQVSQEELKPDIQFSTFRSWQEVGSWYNDLQRTQMQVTPQIQAKVAELTKGLTSDEAKTQAIYDYVSTRFHYVSLSFGVGRYQPHLAEDVLENEYGDCKDKHTLLATMLKAAGVEAWPALINADRKLDDNMPSPAQFDHVITYVPRSSGPFWLDTTPGAAPFNMLLRNLRNRQALVVPNDKPAELKTTAANPPFPADQTFATEGSIDKDGTLTAHVKQTVRGDYEVLFRLAFRNTAPAQWKELMQRISNSEGFGGEVSNVTASSPDDTTKLFEVSYDYTRKKYSDWENHRMIAPLPPTGLEGAAVQEKKPADPVLLGGLGEVVYTANITLPVDVEGLQSDVSLKETYADYQSSYSHVGNVLLVKRRLKIKQNEVPLASWDNYKKFSKALSDDWSAYTTLYAASGSDKSVSGGGASSASNGSSSDTPPREVMEKWTEADEAVKRNDLTTAEDILRELLKKYPDQAGLHGALGTVIAQRGDTNGGIAEFLKEEQLHPDLPQAYDASARFYVYLHRDDDAAQQYRLWIQHDPKNHDAYSGLSSILYRQKKYPEALQLWEAAEKQLPDNARVKSSLGYAYVYNNQAEKGIPLIEQGLTPDSKPMDYNNASYMLADKDVQLDKAKEWGDKAIQGLYTESLNSASEDSSLANTRSIAMTWDTVGWVYYKRGDYEKASSYLGSAFTLSQDGLIGDHLAQVYAKQGKKQEAAHTYRLAYSSASYGPYAKTIEEHFRQVIGPTAALGQVTTTRRPDGTWTPSPAEELSRARTFQLSKQSAAKGSATFSIVFSPGKIESVKFISGDEHLKSMTQQIASSKLRADFPDSTPARLTRRGVLVCGGTGCDFTFLLPNDAYNTENMPLPK